MLDPDIAAMMQAMAAGGFRLPDPLEPTALRQMLDNPIPGPPIAIAERRDLSIPVAGDDGAGALPARLYHPAPGTLRPVIVFFHGGGWVHGTLDTHDRLAAVLAVQSGCALISVGYRLAPEHPFPAALDDALAACRWVRGNAASIGGDGGSYAVAGDSAGGNLATAVAQALAGDGADDKDGPSHQLLLYPALDGACDTPSFATDPPGFLSSDQMRWYWDCYAPGSLRADGAASPMRGSISAAVAPATIIAAGNDPLHDEAITYAERLMAAGVPVALHDFDTAIHGFASLLGIVPLADRAVAVAAAALQAALAPQTEPPPA